MKPILARVVSILVPRKTGALGGWNRVCRDPFLHFFELPGEEWKWSFDLPAFDARFIALDLNHISDLGTTWQTCHPFLPGSEQFEWYQQLILSHFSFPGRKDQKERVSCFRKWTLSCPSRDCHAM
jgi:hypothetical protein